MGCTDSSACNYDDSATEDDGSCIVNDECGVCGGDGIPEGYCYCYGNQLDSLGVCGGDCEYDLNNDGVCDPLCPADISGDGAVTVQDLLLVLSEFGCSVSCENDVTQDGYVAVDDLLLILGAFGSTCY